MIYVLEDDASIRELVVYSLCGMNLPAKGFELPSEFFAAVNDVIPELALLDIMLPEEGGLSILGKLKSNKVTKDIPVIMMTAKSSEFDIVTALDHGADDYITKPFGVMEMVARVKAVLRRSTSSRKEQEGEGEPICIGELRLEPSKHTVTVCGEIVALTLKEFELLFLLLKNRDMVLTRDRILSEVWGYDFDGENRTVDVHIRSLRSKLCSCGGLIETVRGVGYKIADTHAGNF